MLGVASGSRARIPGCKCKFTLSRSYYHSVLAYPPINPVCITLDPALGPTTTPTNHGLPLKVHVPAQHTRQGGAVSSGLKTEHSRAYSHEPPLSAGILQLYSLRMFRVDGRVGWKEMVAITEKVALAREHYSLLLALTSSRSLMDSEPGHHCRRYTSAPRHCMHGATGQQHATTCTGADTNHKHQFVDPTRVRAPRLHFALHSVSAGMTRM